MKKIGDSIYHPAGLHDGYSPFYFPIIVDSHKLKCDMKEFTNAIKEEGIGIGDRYGCLVSTWKWCKDLMYDNYISKNALSMRDRCFHLYVNEKYGERELIDIIKTLVKVSKYYKIS